MNERTHHGQDDLCVGKDVLDHSCRSLRAIIGGMSDAMFIKDRDGRYRLCNASAARFIGKRSEDIIGQDDSALFPVTTAESIREQDRLVMADAKVVTVEEILAMPGGELRTFLSTKGPIFDQQGRVSGVFGIARDMTEQKQGERALREAHTAVELAMEGISKLDATGRYLFVNARYAALLGYQPEELVGQSWEITVHPEDRSAVVAAFNRMLTVGKAEGEFRGIRKDGTVFDKHVVIVKPQGKAEEQSGHYCFVKDITDRKVTERREYETRQLLASMTRVQSLFIDEAKPEAVWNVLLEELLRLTNSEYGFIGEVRSDECQPVLTTYAITNIAWNAESRDLSARRAPTFEFRNLKTLFEHVMTSGQPVIANDPANDPRAGGLPPGHPPMHAFLGLPFFYGGVMTGMIVIANRPGGYDETLVAHLQPLLGTCGQLVEGFRNKRLRSEAEQALRASEDRFRLIFMHEPECVKTVAPDGMLLAMNPTGLRMVEAASLEEVVGRSVMSLIHSDDRSAFWEAHCAAANGSASALQFRVIGLKGQLRWMDTHSVPLREAGGTITAVLSVTRDITERKRADAALRESEERLRALYDDNPSMFFTVTPDGRILSVNRFGAQQLGYQPEELIGGLVSDIVYEEDNAFVRQELAQAFSDTPGNVTSLEFRKRTREGTVIWVRERLRIVGAGEAGPVALIVCEDISARKKTEAALAEREEHLRLFIEHSPVSLAMFDREMRYLAVSRRWKEEYRIGDERLIGRSHYDVFPEIPERWRAVHRRCLAGAVECCEEDPFVRTDGRIDWSRWEIRPWRTADGNVGGIIIFSEDITARKQAECALRESEERFRVIADTAPILIWMSGIDKRCTYFNACWLDYTGRAMEEELGDGWAEGVHPEDADRCLLIYSGAFDRRESFNMEYRLRKADGQYGWIHDNGVPRFFPDGTFAGYLGACIDITARKMAEESLQRTRFAMDQAVDAVYWIDPQARILYANDAASAMLGYTPDEFLRMTVHDLNPDFPPEVWPGWWAETKEKRVISLETVHLTKDGRRIPIDIRVSFLAYGGQEFHCAYVRDIRERKRVDEALRASQERFELAARATNDGIWDWNILTGEQYWSDRHLELFGLEPRAVTPTYAEWISLVHPDDADRVHQATCRHLEIREPYDIEMRVRMKDGRYRWFRDRGQALWDTTGRPVRMVGSISDVTEQRNAEEALRNAHAELEQRVVERTSQLAQANRLLRDEVTERKRVEDRLQTTQYAVDHAADQIFVIGPDGFFLDVNESACSRLGYTKAELLTMSVMDIDPDFPPAKWSEFWPGFAQAGQLRLETRHRAKSGEIYPVEVVANYLCHAGQELDYAIVRDITERKRAEEAVHDSELRYKLLTESTFDGIAIHDQGILIEVNAGLERIFGYESGELVGRSIWDLIADESRDLILANMNNGVNGPYEAMGCRKDGTTFPGEIVVRPYRYRGKNVRLVAGRDITERKRLEVQLARHTEELERQVAERTAEIAKLEAQRTQTEKLAALGRLAAGVAHEINNPIAGIKNAFTLVRQAVDPAHPNAEFAGLIDREIARVASIIQNMYQLCRPEARSDEMVDVWTMVKDLEALLTPLLQQRRLTLVVDLMSSLQWLCVPRGDLMQVMLNLLTNAIECSPEGSAITLSLREEADGIRLVVSDQGAGIEPEHLPHIFDPFYTTKTGRDQKGMGLGLSVSQSLVQAMGGTIEVDTQVQRGSTFTMRLPRDRVGVKV